MDEIKDIQEIELNAIYEHFKKRKYKTLHFATCSETKEKQVVYMALYGDFEIYVRPLSMFAGMVDRKSYVGWRFTKIS